MPNITKEELDKIIVAYSNIESPCHCCPFRSETFCEAFSTPIVEDSPDVFIPCSDCESAVSDHV